MAVRRVPVLVATIALMWAALAAVATPAGADGVITPSATTVPVGGWFSVTFSACDDFEETATGYRYQFAQISFLVGEPGAQRAVTLGAGGVGGRDITIPSWVDPDEPAVLSGSCHEVTQDYESMESSTIELFVYPDVAVDITPAESEVRSTTLVLSRDTAAGGQIIDAQISGCLDGEYAAVTVMSGTDLSLTGSPRHEAGTDGQPATSGVPTTVELELTRQWPQEVLPEGDYVVVAACYDYQSESYRTWLSEPTWLYVRGAVGGGTMTVEESDSGELVIAGQGCVAGSVTVRVRGSAYGLEEATIDDTFTPTVDVAGTWSTTWSTSHLGYSVQISADCGDPRADGFRYPSASWYQDGFSDQWIGRISPTESPVGTPVRVHVQGVCDGTSTVQVRSDDGTVLSEGPVVAGGLAMLGSAEVTAPSEAGTYEVIVVCNGRPSWPDSITVFEPTPLAPAAPLPQDPRVGWPRRGAGEEFNGRIGPISLPAGNHHGATVPGDPATAAGLGPSALGIAVPRPAGDFAITKMSFDLVDENGNSVSTQDAHLHHLVIADLTSANSACPGGTFGLPGEIIAAAGAERTAVDFGDPYGLVVEESDAWAGVYELMNMTDEDQTVYLTYDMEIRRDVENVRPVSTYFGSATGCGSFTWTIDGSGTPDTQGHFITVANDGVLVGAGGHLHSGGLYTDLYDDRGRRICRSELVVGTDPHEHPTTTTTTSTTLPDDTTTTTEHHHGAVARAGIDSSGDGDGEGDDGSTSTTEVIGPIDEWPPEMYPDDPPLEAITGCRTQEQLVAGERLYFEATYQNDRARTGVMGIFMLYVWEGGGPARPVVVPTRPDVGPVPTTAPHHDHGTPTTKPGGTSPGHGHPTDPAAPDGPHDPGHPVDPDGATRPGHDDPTHPGGPDAPIHPDGSAHRPAEGAFHDHGAVEGSTAARPATAAHAHVGHVNYAG